jgi:protocatechuate 3,4-dioxygenase beta subunit
MPTKRQRSRSKLLGTPLDRRQALKGMGALAITAPTIMACAENGVTGAGTGGTSGDVTATGGVTGTGGFPGTGGATGGLTGTGGLPGTGGTPATGGIVGTGGNTSGTGGATGKGGAGGAAGGAAGTAGTSGAAGNTAGSTGAAGAGGSLASMFDKAATCTLTPTDPAGEGPFFIHDGEGSTEELIRSDTRDGQAGVTLQLNLRILDSTMGCNAPVSGAQVYVWHTNAIGYYSGFNSQNPDMPYSGAADRTPDNQDRFLRGIQISDEDGIVSFTSIFPGWYDGRAIHIHFVALRPGSSSDSVATDAMSYRNPTYMIFTTQMYFEEAFSRNIHENYAPYNTRASGANYNKYVKPETMVRPTSHMSGDTAIGFLNIITASNGSRR